MKSMSCLAPAQVEVEIGVVAKADQNYGQIKDFNEQIFKLLTFVCLLQKRREVDLSGS